ATMMAKGGSRLRSAPAGQPMSYTVPWAPFTKPTEFQMFLVNITLAPTHREALEQVSCILRLDLLRSVALVVRLDMEGRRVQIYHVVVVIDPHLLSRRVD